MTALSMGTRIAHFVDDFEGLELAKHVRIIETREISHRTTSSSSRVDRGNIEVRLGSAASGKHFRSTCSCAAVASSINELTERRINVHTPGGVIEVLWREDNEVVMTGRADVVYSGEWLGNRDDEAGTMNAQ